MLTNIIIPAYDALAALSIVLSFGLDASYLSGSVRFPRRVPALIHSLLKGFGLDIQILSHGINPFPQCCFFAIRLPLASLAFSIQPIVPLSLLQDYNVVC